MIGSVDLIEHVRGEKVHCYSTTQLGGLLCGYGS